MGTKTEHAVWDKYWSRENATPQKDDVMSLFLAYSLDYLSCDYFGSSSKSSLEMGAGSGRTSRYLNEMGARTGILDISEEALRLCQYVTQGLEHPVDLYLANIFEVSKANVPHSYDLVWNAGVLEHFPPPEQTEILRRMLVPLSEKGYVVLFTPYAGSLFYRVGKYLLEKLNAFPYGREIPVHTLRDVLPPELVIAKPEKSVGFVILLFNAFKALSSTPVVGPVFFILNRIFNPFWCQILRNPAGRTIIFAVDALFSRAFGGYLLLSVCRRT